MNTSRLTIPCVIVFLLFTTVACKESAKITSFSVSPTSFTAGSSAQLCYELVDAVSARIDPNIGELSDKNKSCLKIEPRQTTNYKLVASGTDGKPMTADVTATVEAPPPLANIITFESRRETAASNPGSPAQLCYEVQGASSLSIKPDLGNVDPLDKGCRTVKPGKTTTYELAATGPDNQTVTKEATVNVVQPPARIVRFDPPSANVKAGEKVRICYHIEDAASAYISNSNHAVKLGEVECIDVQPKRSATLRLVARNSDGESVSREARITVEQLPVEIVDFEVLPRDVEKGNEAVVRYKITNAVKGEIKYPGGVVPIDRAEGEVKIRPSGSGNVVLAAHDPDGKVTATPPIAVQVVAPQRAQFLFRPTNVTINRGDEATLCYGVTMGSRVYLDSDQPGLREELESSEKKCIRRRPAETAIFTFTAIGPDRAPVSAQATVTVTVPPSSASFVARSATQRGTEITILRGDPAQLCYALANVADAAINPRFGRVEVRQVNCLNLGDLAEDTVFTLSARGMDGRINTRQVTVRVYPPPQILSFDGRRSGNQNLLCFEYRYGVRAVLSPQIGDVTSSSGRRCVPVPSPSSASYTLTVQGRGKVPPAVATFPRR